MKKAERDAIFLGKPERGLSQVRAGQDIVKTMDELEAMAEDAERILKEFADDYERMAK